MREMRGKERKKIEARTERKRERERETITGTPKEMSYGALFTRKSRRCNIPRNPMPERVAGGGVQM